MTEKQKSSSIRFGFSLLLLAPGIAVVGAAIGLALLALAILLFVSLSGVIAIAFVVAGFLFIIGGIFLWPVRDVAKGLFFSAISALLAGVLSKRS